MQQSTRPSRQPFRYASWPLKASYAGPQLYPSIITARNVPSASASHHPGASKRCRQAFALSIRTAHHSPTFTRPTAAPRRRRPLPSPTAKPAHSPALSRTFAIFCSHETPASSSPQHRFPSQSHSVDVDRYVRTRHGWIKPSADLR